VYGVEPQQSGVGGLAAQAPPDVYFPQALGISNTQPIIASPQIDGTTAPFFGPSINAQQPSSLMSTGGPAASGQSVRIPVSQMQSHWSSILDFHNSPGPWFLIALLVLYGWLHVSVRARAGRRVSGAVVL
jgi:hypothetical protein